METGAFGDGHDQEGSWQAGAGLVFNIVDDEPAQVRDWLLYLAGCAGAKRPMRLPKWLAGLLAGELAVVMMTEGRGFSNARARRELGWEPRYLSWRQGFREEIAGESAGKVRASGG